MIPIRLTTLAKLQQPSLLRQGCNAEHSDGNGEQGFRHVELVVKEIDIIILFLKPSA